MIVPAPSQKLGQGESMDKKKKNGKLIMEKTYAGLKKYFEILSITLLIQLTGFVGMEIGDSLFKNGTAGVGLLFMCLIASTLTGIIAPLFCFSKVSHKILAILFLPTNYTMIIMIFILNSILTNILNGIRNMPPNFG